MKKTAPIFSFIRQLQLDDYVIISATGRHTYGWGDRGFSGSRFFFENLLDQESDKNVDGKATVRRLLTTQKRKT